MFHSLIKLLIRSTVSQNENQKAVVQELDSYADAAPTCQWCHPVQRKEVRGAGEREGKSMEITFQNPSIFSATTPHLNPHPVQEHTVLSDDPGMLPGRKRWALKVRFNPSYQRLEAGFNSCLECPSISRKATANLTDLLQEWNYHSFMYLGWRRRQRAEPKP